MLRKRKERRNEELGHEYAEKIELGKKLKAESIRVEGGRDSEKMVEESAFEEEEEKKEEEEKEEETEISFI